MKESIGEFFKELFDVNIPFTKSDLDMILGIYRLMEKGLKKNTLKGYLKGFIELTQLDLERLAELG